MKTNELSMLCLLLFVFNLVTVSLARSLLKTLPTEFHDHYSNYNPEENRGSKLFLAEGDILIDRELYYSMLDWGDGDGDEAPDSQTPEMETRNNTPETAIVTAKDDRVRRSHKRQKRSIDSAYHSMWMNRSVPYQFDRNFGPNEKAMVERAMSVLENLSCVRFKERRRNEVDYVHILVPNQGGCYSKVGRNGGRQDIGLSSECNFGTAIHELLHALGMWHEHNRKDREDYITVIWDNIKDGKKDNFKISRGQNPVILRQAYDYGSIMHYTNNTFSKIGHQLTLKPKKPLAPGVVMGQREGPSQLDMDKLNALYMCDIRNCSHPGRLPNGNVHGPIFTVGSKVIYSCMPGYILIGAPERVCLTMGKWSGDQPSCIANTTRDPIHYCNFDRPLCSWTQSNEDGMDWTPHHGATATAGTGPYWDNTLNTPSGVYLYMEASSANRGTTARLVSPVFEAGSRSSACLVLFAHMYGNLMGSLSVYKLEVGANQTTEELLYSIQGDQGKQWRQVFLVLGEMAQPYHIIIEGAIGGGYSSDIAIDDITVGSCKNFKPIAVSDGREV